jgi:hypothetical protein
MSIFNRLLIIRDFVCNAATGSLDFLVRFRTMATSGSHTLTFASLATNSLTPTATTNVIESSTIVYDFASTTINRFYVRQPTPGYILFREEPSVKSN